MKRQLLRAALAAAAIVGTGASCRNPSVDANIYQQLNEAADQFSSIRQDIGIMSVTIDSMRTVIAQQDSVIRRLATIAGIPIAR